MHWALAVVSLTLLAFAAISGRIAGTPITAAMGFEGWFALVFPVWMLALTGILLVRARRIPPELRLPASRPSLVPRQQPMTRSSQED
jgi:hypothetical protein